MKDGMSGMLQQVRLGQVRKARRSSIIRPPSFPFPFFKIHKKSSDKGSPWRCQVMKERAGGPIQTS